MKTPQNKSLTLEATVFVYPVRYIIEIIFINFSNTASHGAITQVPAQRETVEAKTLTGNLVKIAAKVFNPDNSVT